MYNSIYTSTSTIYVDVIFIQRQLNPESNADTTEDNMKYSNVLLKTAEVNKITREGFYGLS